MASGGEYFDSSKLQATLDSHSANAKFGAYFGIKALKANLSRRLGQEDLDSGNARILARNLNEVGKRTLEHGVKFAFHPHAWTMAERKAEVEMLQRDEREPGDVNRDARGPDVRECHGVGRRRSERNRPDTAADFPD